MSISGADTWGTARQAFADQFEQDGNSFVYRRSQKGQAIRVSAEERDRFIEEFGRSVRRATWIIYAGLAVILGSTILFSVERGSDLSQGVVFAGIAVATVPYFAYYHWAWKAPSRELAGRTPVAGERSAEDVQRLRFQRITYAQLGMVALSGLAAPFWLSGRKDLFLGWNRLWLVLGGGLILLAAVQAFRKWRFEAADNDRTAVSQRYVPVINAPPAEPVARREFQFWPYLPVAIILGGLAFVAYTSAGRQLAKTPEFWPTLILAFGCWALFTVARGFQNGQVEPIVRGLHNTYERQSEPKRYWLSMAWNGLLGCFCVWMAFTTYTQHFLDDYETRCDNTDGKYAPQEAMAACNKLIDKRQSENAPVLADAFWGRGNARHSLHDVSGAIADYSQALRITPQSRPLLENRAAAYAEERAAPQAIADYNRVLQLDPRAADDYYYRAYVYERLLHDRTHAIGDYSAAIAIEPDDADSLYRRGLCYGSNGDYQDAIADLSATIRLKPSFAPSYYFRAEAYHMSGQDQLAGSDLATLRRLDPQFVERLRMARSSQSQ